MTLPKGASLAHGEVERIRTALAEVDRDTHAPRELNVKVTLHVHREYPKTVVVGENEDGSPKTELIHSAEEERTTARSSFKRTPKLSDFGDSK